MRAMMKYTCAARSWRILLQILKLLRDTLRRHDGSPGKSLEDIFTRPKTYKMNSAQHTLDNNNPYYTKSVLISWYNIGDLELK